MAKRGRPRKSGHRETSGRLQRPTLAQLKDADTAKRLRETDAVAMQPHRRWAPDPRDPRLESALGRFAIRNRLRAELIDAGREWGETYRRWCAAKGVPDALHARALGAGGAGPSAATVDAWDREILRIDARLREHGSIAYLAARSLCLDNADISSEATDDAIVGLRVVAEELGRLPRGAHPFVDSRAAA
jgi:hypothetical protein